MNTSNYNTATDSLKPAGIFKMIAALFVDWYIMSLITTFPIYLLQSLDKGELTLVNSIADLPDTFATVGLAIGIAVSFLYSALLPAFRRDKHTGQTFGRQLFKIRIINVDGSAVEIKAMLLRALYMLTVESTALPSFYYLRDTFARFASVDVNTFALCCFIVTAISLGICIFERRHRTGHDIISGTRVVSE